MMSQRIWLITGVSTGFGRELTQQLLAKGDRVVGTVRNLASVQPLMDQWPETFHPEILDVTDTDAIAGVVERTFKRFGRIDVAISNAGYGLFGAAEELSDRQIEQMIAASFPSCASRAGGGLSKSRPMAGRWLSPVIPSITLPNGGLKALSSRSRRKSLPLALA